MPSTLLGVPPGARRLAGPLLAYAFLDDFVLLYPLYTLLFAATGLSAAEISSLLVVWSVTSVVLEVPSGVWADTVSRRALLVAGPLLGAAGFALWVLVPSYPAFAAGFVLWGAKGALVSGSFEALVYDELELVGAAGAFATLLGRAHAAAGLAVVAATMLAAPVMASSGYAGLGAASVAAGLAGALVALALPEHRDRRPEHGAGAEEVDEPGYLTTLRAGLREARADVRVRRLVVVVAGAAAIWGALEEYTPLVAVAAGVPVADVPWWELALWGGVAAGAVLAGRVRRIGPRGLATALGLAALALAVGAGGGRPAGLALVALAFGVFQAVDVVLGSWLQDALSGAARATVTSVAAVGAELVAVAVYALYGAVAGVLGAGGAVAALAMLYLPVVVWAWRVPVRAEAYRVA
jgi:MFS family permease